MSISDILGLMGGLALFLYGLNMMSEGLEDMAGHHLEHILKTLTNTKMKAVWVGTIVTALIQSSSAMTVMLISFVNSGMMPLENALWVVMGANIGTTMTGQLLALHVNAIAPLLAFIGVILIVSSKHLNHIGEAIGGMGLLFMGLEIMSLSLTPLKESAFFLRMLTWMNHPLIGILVGAIFTGMIQSSSASIGILQSLAKAEFISLQQSAYIIFGFEIGTCATALVASLTGSKIGKQLAFFHVLLNVFGTVLFTIICLLTPFLHWIEILTPNLIMRQIANIQTIFNIGTTLIALCLDKYFMKVVYDCIPSSKGKD